MQNPAGTYPPFFQFLIDNQLLQREQLLSCPDHFFAAAKSLSAILAIRGILRLYNRDDQPRDCNRFFDDWYLYAVPDEDSYVYSLLKLREQESDFGGSVPADGDTPGVTVSFIAFDPHILTQCLDDPSMENRKQLYEEINRVVAARKQTHHRAMKAYFVRAEAEAPYLIAEMYIRHIASFVENGAIPVPEAFSRLCQTQPDSRLPRFISENNAAAGHTVCDMAQIFLRDSQAPSRQEQLAILATHTGNVSYHCFAAEIRYHACFLTGLAKIPLPFLGRSLYASAVRADMTIDDKELEGPAPFHRTDSTWVRRQEALHPQF